MTPDNSSNKRLDLPSMLRVAARTKGLLHRDHIPDSVVWTVVPTSEQQYSLAHRAPVDESSQQVYMIALCRPMQKPPPSGDHLEIVHRLHAALLQVLQEGALARADVTLNT